MWQKLSNQSPQFAIQCIDVTKEFFFSFQKSQSIRQNFLGLIQRNRFQPKPIFSLKGFNLTVYQGESLALVGSNGSGKSTLLRLMAGIYEPNEGRVHAEGRIGAVIELGAGFHRELTGAANVELYGAILGMNRKERAQRFGEIVEFSEIHEYIRIPVKFYSAGMIARLAFSVEICANPDILLLDEVLSVGDHAFKEKSLARLNEFRSKGKTLVVTSHDQELLSKLCTRAVWLDRGRIRLEGKPEEVLESYYKEHHEARGGAGR